MNEKEAEYRREQRREKAVHVLRWAVGLPLMVLPYPRLGIPGVLLVVVGCVTVAPDVAALMVRLLEGIFYEHRPPRSRPIYSIPESLVMKGKLAEAEAEYEKIIEAFPDEVKPHTDMISLAVLQLDDAELAAKLYERGLATLPSRKAREELARLYPLILSRRERHDVARRA